MDITHSRTERKPALADPAGRYLTAIRWRRMARELLTKAENQVFGRVVLAQQKGSDHWWGQISLALWCSDVASIIEGCKPVELPGRRQHVLIGQAVEPDTYHCLFRNSYEAWIRHITPIGHSITVEVDGKHITRLGLCDVCGDRVDYVMSDVEAARWLAGVDQEEV
jgi:hypothetical protein